MIDHRTMELLGCASGLTDLEIQGTIGAMRDCLHLLQSKHSRRTQLTDRLPVGGSRTGFHEKEGLALGGTHTIVFHSTVQGRLIETGLMPGGIIIPGDIIQVL